jgi:hypothetical protein
MNFLELPPGIQSRMILANNRNAVNADEKDFNCLQECEWVFLKNRKVVHTAFVNKHGADAIGTEMHRKRECNRWMPKAWWDGYTGRVNKR